MASKLKSKTGGNTARTLYLLLLSNSPFSCNCIPIADPDLDNRVALMERKFNPNNVKNHIFSCLKGTVSQDWEGLEMIEIDDSHLFTVAGARLFLNLTMFS